MDFRFNTQESHQSSRGSMVTRDEDLAQVCKMPSPPPKAHIVGTIARFS